jgi:FMN phosphatase YigB (HAD superfamily)
MQQKKAIVIDCDGTLYGPDAGVEQQIVANIHGFGKAVLGLSAADCDDLHAR